MRRIRGAPKGGATEVWAHPGYELTMAALAMLSVAVLFADEASWARPVNLAVWAIFVIDYAVRLWSADRRWRFVRSNVIDLVAILPADAFRLARVARLARLARAGSLLWRSRRSIVGVLNTNGTGGALVVAVGVIAGGAGIAYWSDPTFESYGDALWWAVVTSTTVGYGDLSPETTTARAVAVAVMLVGIGTVGLLTASIANYFASDRSQDVVPSVAAASVTLADGRTVALDADQARLVEALLRSTRTDT